MDKRRWLILSVVFRTGLFFLFIVMISSCRGPSTPPPDEEHELDTTDIRLLYGLDVSDYLVIDSVVPAGSFFGGLMGSMGVSAAAIHEMVVLSDTIFDLRRMRAGNRCLYVLNPGPEPSLRWFVYHISRVQYVVFDFGMPMQIWTGALDVDTVRNEYSGIIRSSLWNAMVADGKNPNLILELSDVFAWVIDFYGIQQGDQFKVIYDELFVEGEHLGIGTIHASWFEHNSKPYYAFRYEQDSITQYFDHEGVSLRREFLKAPLQFSRISSHFSHSRMHPILRIRRAHHGVDYAAPAGTPVRTIGDGTVLEARYAGGAGNMVKIRHNSTYTTVYMHLRGFAKGIRAGVRVNQGDLIGYVGSTGLSTGPHLDFRVFKNGTPINPLTLESPPADPIHPENLDQYKEDITALKKALDRIPNRKLKE